MTFLLPLTLCQFFFFFFSYFPLLFFIFMSFGIYCALPWFMSNGKEPLPEKFPLALSSVYFLFSLLLPSLAFYNIAQCRKITMYMKLSEYSWKKNFIHDYFPLMSNDDDDDFPMNLNFEWKRNFFFFSLDFILWNSY